MKKLNKKGLVLAFILLLAILVGLGGFMYYRSGLEPVSHVENPIEFEISEGENADQILKDLKDNYIIKNELVAKLVMKQKGLSDFKAGTYTLDKSWTPEEILTVLNDPNAAMSNQVSITIPEGCWAKDIAETVAENTNVSAEELMALWNDEAFLDEMIAKYEFLDESIKNPELTVALEGYLYPETYFFYRETNARDVTMRFLDEFDRNYQMFKGQLEGSEMSFHDLITLASVVQFESGHPDDMKLIAGIFENRLRDGYRLQSSVTVCYALYEYDSWLDCEQNYEVESPYNTYMIDGLPIGPVCNPGIDAIEAVLNPTPSDYMYFIADVYGDKTVYYATTYEEHLANIEQYLNY